MELVLKSWLYYTTHWVNNGYNLEKVSYVSTGFKKLVPHISICQGFNVSFRNLSIFTLKLKDGAIRSDFGKINLTFKNYVI